MTSRKPTHTPPRSIRIEEALWQEAKAAAAERGETVTDAVRKALRGYVGGGLRKRVEALADDLARAVPGPGILAYGAYADAADRLRALLDAE